MVTMLGIQAPATAQVITITTTIITSALEALAFKEVQVEVCRAPRIQPAKTMALGPQPAIHTL